MRRWAIAVASVVGLTATMLGGCARGTGNASDPQALGGSDEARVTSIAAKLDALSQLIGGTPTQRLAGDVIDYHAFQDPIRECMKRSRFSYTPPPLANAYRGETVIHMGIGDAEWFAPLRSDSLGVGVGFLALTPNDQDAPNPGFDNLDASGKARYESALDGCKGLPFTDVNFPPMSTQLQGEFMDMMLSVSVTPEAKSSGSGYSTCLAAHGVTGSDYDDLIEQLSTMYGRVHAASVTHATAGPTLSQAQAYERQAAAADVACRRATYDLAMILVEPKLTAFENDHQNDLRVLASQWNSLVTQASAFPEFSNGG